MLLFWGIPISLFHFRYFLYQAAQSHECIVQIKRLFVYFVFNFLLVPCFINRSANFLNVSQSVMNFLFLNHRVNIILFKTVQGRILEHRHIFEFFVELFLHITSYLMFLFVFDKSHRDSFQLVISDDFYFTDLAFQKVGRLISTYQMSNISFQ